MTAYNLKQAFEKLGKSFSGRSSSFTSLLPMLVGGVDGTNVGTTVFYNNTGKVVDQDHGSGRVCPNDLVIITQVGNAERYTKYTTLPIDVLQNYINTTTDRNIFRLRKDACKWLEHARLEITVQEINELFKP